MGSLVQVIDNPCHGYQEYASQLSTEDYMTVLAALVYDHQL